MRGRKVSMLVIGAMCLISAVAWHTAVVAQQPQENAVDGIRLARAINSAQVSQSGTYADVRELIGDPVLSAFAPAIQFEGEIVRIGNHRIMMVLAADRKHYQFTIVPDSGCGTAWFSSDRGMIYTGRALGC
jgi:hypothetical protein